jgi:small subunit ribosomal protein S9
MSDTRQSLSDLAELTEGQASATEGETPVVQEPATPLREQQLDKQGRAYATGRRKDAVARVWLKPGTGQITVNGRDQTVYFARPTLRLVINQPFDIADRRGQFLCVLGSRRE